MNELESSVSTAEKPDWKKLLVFLGILAACFFVGNLVLALLAMAAGLPLTEDLDIFGAISDEETKPFIKTAIGLNHLIIFTGTALFYAIWAKKEKWLGYFDWVKVDFGLLILFVALLICAYPIITASATIFEDVEWVQQMDETNLEALMQVMEMSGGFDLFVNLIIIGLLPAIGEELLFRGVIQKELITKFSSSHFAIILTSIIFAAVHLQIQGFFPKLFIGLILGYAYYWTRSLWYPIVLHFLNNAIPTVMLFLAGDEIEAMQEEAIKPEKVHLLIGVVFSFFLCIFLIRIIRKQIDENKSPTTENG